MLANNLKLCMHVHIISSSSYSGHVDGSALLSFSCSGLACVFQLCAEMLEFCDCCGKWVWPSGEPEEWEETWEPIP
jgi:hypothetical protein